MEHKTPRVSILEALSQEDDSVLMLAYLYAKNLHLYGIDVTESLKTATEQCEAMRNAYNKGYKDGSSNVSRFTSNMA